MYMMYAITRMMIIGSSQMNRWNTITASIIAMIIYSMSLISIYLLNILIYLYLSKGGCKFFKSNRILIQKIGEPVHHPAA